MALNTTLCLKFCMYYKPGKKEQLACRGHQVVERLQQRGLPLSFEIAESCCESAVTEMLVKHVCVYCDFRIDGCDFILDRQAPPCGGFLFLSQLLADGTISAADLD